MTASVQTAAKASESRDTIGPLPPHEAAADEGPSALWPSRTARGPRSQRVRVESNPGAFMGCAQVRKEQGALLEPQRAPSVPQEDHSAGGQIEWLSRREVGSTLVSQFMARARNSGIAEARHEPVRWFSRAELAAQRAILARAALANCHLCAHHCGVNRLAGERGRCRAGTRSRVFLAQTDVGDERELAPSFNIAFSGCDLRCEFCITADQSWNPHAGEWLDVSALAQQAQAALESGARSIQFLGGEPTVHLPTALELVALLPDSAQLVWKTNAHASAQARELLEDLFDVWVADYKFGNDRCAESLAGVPRYTSVIRENLLWAAPRTDLIVRHLLMPGHIECCWRPVAEWLAESLPQVKVSLRVSFWPTPRNVRHTELRRSAKPEEVAQARAIAEKLNLKLVQ